jgi:outer membrane protein assembly factor BamD
MWFFQNALGHPAQPGLASQMTLFSVWRIAAPIVVAFMAMQLGGCGSDPKDELAGKTAERLYRDAKDEIENGAYERAISALERVEGLAAGTLLAQQAQLDLAYAFWKAGERAQASTTIERFIKLNPSSAALDYAMFLRGIINFNENLGLMGGISGQDISERDQRASRDAYAAFKQLVEQFPDSKYSADARLRMDFIVTSLAAYEVHVARYYMRRGAFVAAANRAKQAITEFEQSPSTEEALYILVRCYDELELTTLRDATDRVLRQNFPTSRYVAGAGATADRPWWRVW